MRDDKYAQNNEKLIKYINTDLSSFRLVFVHAVIPHHISLFIISFTYLFYIYLIYSFV